MFDNRFTFVHDSERSREYRRARYAVRDGVALVAAEESASDRYRVDVNDGEGMLRDRTGATERATYLLRTEPLGTTVAVLRVRDGRAMDRARFRRSTTAPPVADTRGVEGVDRFEGYVRSQFPNARFAGDCVCKPDSDHRDCAAVDYFDTYANMDRMRDMALTEPGYFHTKYVILRDRIYYVRDDGTWYSLHYTQNYHAHIHFSCYGGIEDSAC